MLSMLNAASMLLIAFRTTRVCSRVRDYLYICPGARPMRGGEGGRPKSTNESSSRCRNTAASHMDAGHTNVNWRNHGEMCDTGTGEASMVHRMRTGERPN
ncbi:hypothetical protein JB92DRAFT_3072649 [Gautieria morchelliformis]|nr:hypothetical protein JB92DRAFT_3072649 [Gautieria morchelliformis]